MKNSEVLGTSRVLNMLLSVIGLVLSVYALYVETKKEEDDSYTAMCDINEIFACTKVFNTKYGKGFGLVGPIFGEEHLLNQPNGLYGIVMYSLMFILGSMRGAGASQALLPLVVLSNCLTPYLAYILYQIGAVCVVCVAMYVVNALLLLVGLWRRAAWLRIQSGRAGKTKKQQ